MTNEEYIGIVKDGSFVALSPESAAGTRLRLTRAAMQASFPPEHEELDPTICEGKAIMIRGHGDGEWIWSTEVVDVAGPILTETVRKLFAVTVTQPVNAGSALGTNLTNISDWIREWCFADAFKASRAWISGSVDGTGNDGRALDMDEDGWVRSLLVGQIARTLLLSDPAGHYPAGRYIVLYEGEGTLEYRDAAQKDIAASRQGRDVIEVDPFREGAIRIQIAAIDESDHLRNIRVIMPGGVCANDPFQWCRDNDDCSSGCISFEGGEQPDEYITEFANLVYASLDSVALPETIQWIQNQAEVASEYGVDLIAYEGGQHLVALPGVWDNSAINQLFDDANHNERMGPLYSSLLAAWRNCGGRLFVHFNNRRLYDKIGLWGALEYLEQRRSDAPKFDCAPDIHRRKSDRVVVAPAI